MPYTGPQLTRFVCAAGQRANAAVISRAAEKCFVAVERRAQVARRPSCVGTPSGGGMTSACCTTQFDMRFHPGRYGGEHDANVICAPAYKGLRPKGVSVKSVGKSVGRRRASNEGLKSSRILRTAGLRGDRAARQLHAVAAIVLPRCAERSLNSLRRPNVLARPQPAGSRPRRLTWSYCQHNCPGCRSCEPRPGLAASSVRTRTLAVPPARRNSGFLS